MAREGDCCNCSDEHEVKQVVDASFQEVDLTSLFWLKAFHYHADNSEEVAEEGNHYSQALALEACFAA